MPDLLVVGAGIVGAAVASLAAAEGLAVQVLSSLTPGDGATAAGMGHLVVLDDDPAELALSAWSMQLWRECAHLATGEHHPCGTLWIASAPDELPALQAKARRLAQAGVPSQALDERALQVAEPALRPGLAGGLRVPGDAVVYAPPVAKAMLDEARARHGLRLKTGVAVRQVLAGGLKLADGRTLWAPAVVIAAGLGSAALLPELRFVPRKGHLAITQRTALTVRHQVVEVGYGASAHGGGDSVAFNLQPRPTGQLLIGSCRQPGRDDAAVDPAMLGAMLRRAIDFVPGLAELPVLRAWTGLRPGTPDGRPCIGRWPALRHVWVAAGHEGLGITTALGTAQLLLAQLLGRECPIDATPFDPARCLREVEACA